VIQAGGTFPHMTARKNITLMAHHLRWPADRIRKRLSALTELTHFPEDALDRYPGQLSGGQCQRLSEDEAHCAVRFSLGVHTSEEDIAYVLDALEHVIRDARNQVRFVSCR